jgi:pectinesterase
MAQSITFIDGIPKDTSFSFGSETIKIQKNYPQAVPVYFYKSENVVLHENIVYSTIGKRNLHLDVFLPIYKEDRNGIAVIIIHGGGWRTGDKKMEWPTANYLASKGFVTATVEYRLSPEAKYPAGIHDLKNSIKWLKANAEEFDVDTNKIVVYGCSAGGQLAAFLGTTGGLKKFEDSNFYAKSTSIVNAVVNIDGIVDFTHPAESNKDSDPLKLSAGKAWFGVSFEDDPTKWIEASPINYVCAKTPPFIFINSSQERFHAGRDYMIEKMNHYDIFSEVHTIKNTPHTFWLFKPWFDELMIYAVNFIEKIFDITKKLPEANTN